MKERSWHHLSAVAIVLMILLVVGNWLIPPPTLGKMVQSSRNQETQLRAEAERLEDKITITRAQNEKRLWVSPADQVAAAAMARVTQIANANDLKVIAFRPQRMQEDAGVTIHPYQVSLDGYFSKVMAFLRTLETPSLKLPVVSVQIAASDGASDRVSATVAIVAYREIETKK